MTEGYKVPSKFVEIFVTDKNDPDKVITQKKLNLYRPASRKWLLDTMWWAVHNGNAIHIAGE